MSDWYILDGPARTCTTPPHRADLLTGAQWFSEHSEDRILAVTQICDDGTTQEIATCESSGLCVSTVFLGLDHAMFPGDVPLLWETLTFQDGSSIDHMRRYATRDEALAGHQQLVSILSARRKQGLPCGEDDDWEAGNGNTPFSW